MQTAKSDWLSASAIHSVIGAQGDAGLMIRGVKVDSVQFMISRQGKSGNYG